MKRLICLGDSLTEAQKGEIQAWPEQLIGRIDYEIINKGIAGDTTVHVFYRFDTDVVPNLPATVIIALGVNDSNCREWTQKARVSVEEYERNLREFHRVITEKGGEVILLINHKLITDQGRFKNQGNQKTYQENFIPYNDVCRKLSKELKCGLIDVAAEIEKRGVNAADILIEDGVHLNALGYHLYTDIIYESLS